MTYSFSYLEPVWSTFSSNCCFLTCIQISQEADQVVWYSHLFQNFPQFIVIHTVKGFGPPGSPGLPAHACGSAGSLSGFLCPMGRGGLVLPGSVMLLCALGLWGVAPLPQWYRARVSGTTGYTVGRGTGSQCRARPQGQLRSTLVTPLMVQIPAWPAWFFKRRQALGGTCSTSDGPGMGSHRQEKVSETEAAGWFYRHTHLGINHT